MAKNCKYCNTPLHGKYCSHCGESSEFKRIDWSYFSHNFEHFIHSDRGFPYTLKQLVVRPGEAIRNFIGGERNRMTKPFVFLILCGIFYAFANYLFHFNEIEPSVENKDMYPVLKWTADHYSYFNLLAGIINVFWIRLFFRKSGYNFFELMTLMCYTIGVTVLIDGVLGFFEKHWNFPALGFIVGVVYLSWAIGQFFGRKWSNYLKALLACLLGFVSLAILLGVIVMVVKLA